ncbi:hypothetical protein CSAL01_07817 [Colletotrichum salicis]|uniref:Uncharacterized protein n=1 Tax=Colletotrichum salicis TaxID=1209931 RepID=A0A135RUX4_9PEZI|nr:hypothetical protein CSAL01_07817 [Colletotrichum salicis]
MEYGVSRMMEEEKEELWTMAENIAKCQRQEARLRDSPRRPLPPFTLPPSPTPYPNPKSANPPTWPPQGSPEPRATLSRHFDDDDDDDDDHNHGLQLPKPRPPNTPVSRETTRGFPSATTTSPLGNFTSSMERHSAIFHNPAIYLQPENRSMASPSNFNPWLILDRHPEIRRHRRIPVFVRLPWPE